VTRDVRRIVTNHATGVRHSELSPVLVVRARDGADVLLAEAGAVGRGRLLAIGDASVCMNSMLRFAGNRALAHGIVRYAVDEDARVSLGAAPGAADGSHDAPAGKLYIASGAFTEHGSFGAPEDVTPAARLRRAWETVLRARHEGLPPIAAYALAVLLGLTLVVWVGARAGRTHVAQVPRFTRPIPLAAQGGLAGHAAVLVAPRAPRALAMLELKSALEDALAAATGLAAPACSPGPGLEALLAAALRRGLMTSAQRDELSGVLLRMAQIETMVIAGKPEAARGPSDRELVRAARLLGARIESLLGASSRAPYRGPPT
jgi:hypothetical protein